MSFPQKVIASGMSLVLAFGLSPIGQVPAYAATGDQPAQQELLTQAVDPNFVLSDKDFTFVVNDAANSATYNGEDQVVTFILFDSAGTRITPTYSGTHAVSGDTATTGLAGQFKLTMTAPDKTVTTATLSNTNTNGGTSFKVHDAGTYTVKVESVSSDSNYYGKGSQTYTFEVGKLDLSTVNFVAKDATGATVTTQTASGANPLKYTGQDQAVTFAGATAGTGADARAVTISQGVDFSADISTVNDVNEYTATITAMGSNCKDGTTEAGAAKYATASFDVVANSFLAASGTNADFAKIVVNGDDVNIVAATGTATATIPSNEASDPIKVKFGDYELTEGTDYEVVFNDDGGTTSKYTKEQLAALTSYKAVVTITNNLKWTTPAAKVVVSCTNGQAVFNKVVKSAVLSSGDYLGGAYVKADPKAGGTFTAPDGTDVSELVGTYFTVGDDYQVLSTNTMATAKVVVGEYSYTYDGGAAYDPDTTTDLEKINAILSLPESGWVNDAYTLNATNDAEWLTANASWAAATKVIVRTATKTYPIGAGDYKVTVTGDSAAQGSPVDATSISEVKYTVNKRAAKEGTEVGDLKVTLNDQPYENGNYLQMKNVTSSDSSGVVTVEMYTTKNSTKQVVDPTYTSATGATITNWKVTYYKEDGTRVSAPAEVGTYKAVFEFPSTGNLAGTPNIEKTFKVETGDISDLVTGLRMKSGTSYISPFHTYTGNGIEIEAKDLYFVSKADPSQYLTTKSTALDGTDVKITYASKTATVGADGLPNAVGTYDIIATFSGNYAGEVKGVLSVNKLPLTNMTNGNNAYAELQFDQGDGTWDTAYSTAKTGSAISPTVRIVLKDGNQTKGDEATEVNPDVYTATFTNNTEPGQASVTLTAAGAGVGNLSTSTSAQAGAFTITDKSFADVAANLELSKSSVEYNDSEFATKGLEVKMNSSAGLLTFGSGAAAAYEDGTATITVTGVTAYYASSKWYAPDAAGTAADTSKEIEGNASEASPTAQKYTNVTFTFSSQDVAKRGSSYYVWNANSGAYEALSDTYGNATGTLTVSDFASEGYTPGKATVTLSATTYLNSADGKYYWDDTTFANPVLGTVSGSSVIYHGVTVYEKSGALYAKTGSTYVSTAAGFLEAVQDVDTHATGTAAVPTTGFIPGSGDYTLKVLDSDGAVVENLDVTSEAPYKAVTIKGIEDAGKYTIVAGTGNGAQYGGRVTAQFEVTATDLSDATKYALTYTPLVETSKETKANVVLSSSDAWDVDYDAATAATKDGITLEKRGTATASTTIGVLAITPAAYAVDPTTGKNAAHSLKLKDDYKVTYENNTAAGTAKVVIEGQGNYQGKVEHEFTINKGVIKAATFDSDTGKCLTKGYRVDFDEAQFVKNASGELVLVFTGAAQTPTYEVNYYEEGATTPTTFLEAGEYEPQWFNNTNVYYPDGSAVAGYGAQLLVKASGNYEGTIIGRFKIDPIDLSTAENVVVEIADQPYTGTAADPTAKVTYNGVELVAGKDYMIQGDGSAEVGEHTATIVDVPGGNYTISAGAIYKTYQIKKAEDIKYDLTGATVALSKTKFTFNNKAQKPTVKSVTLADGTLLDAALYTATIPSKKAAGSYTVTVKGATDNVTGTATAKFTIAKAANTLKVANAKRTVKAAKLKKAAQKVTGLKVSKAGKGTMTYKVTKVTKGKKTVAKKNFKVAKSSVNKLTVKKGLAKGTYKVTMTAKAKGNANYSASKVLKKVVTVVVK